MAIDKTAKKMQDVDLDDIEVVILIVAKNPGKVSPAANFLSRRGWPTTTMSDLSNAIEFATDNKPDIVLISVNHPHPTLQKFSDLLTSTLGTTCVAFAENLDNTSAARLSKNPTPLKIPGQASGPNLHRSLRNILAKKLSIELDERAQKGGTANDGQTIVQKSEPGATHGKGATLIKGESAAPVEPKFDSEQISTGKYTMTKKTRRTLKEISSNPLEQPGDVVMGSQSADLAAHIKRSLFGTVADPNLIVSEAENMESAERASEESAYENGVVMASSQQRPVDGGPASAVKRQPAMKTDKKKAAAGPHSSIERAVGIALEKICRPSTGEHAPIGMIENVGVFPVDSPSLPGYLVLAWPHGELRAIEPFFNKAQQIIAATFGEMGIQARLEPGFFVTLPEVEFGGWAAEKAAFSFSTAHGAEEIGVAFFSTAKPIPKPKPIEDKSMYSIDLENISTERPVTFKVYLHMKKNKKYFLYLRNGRQLQPEQKERLLGRQVKDLYMKTIDAENLRMFMATCYLSEKIKKAG